MDSANTSQAQEEPAAAQHSAFAKEWGQWAFDHRADMTSQRGHVMYRNMLRTLVALVPTTLGFGVAMHGFRNMRQHGPDWLQPIAKSGVAENAARIFTGFMPFRVVTRLWQRNYDRIFNPAGTAEESAAAIDALPGNIASDLKEVLPGEIAGNALSCVVLAGVKASLKTPEPSLLHNPAQAQAGYVNDWLSSSAAFVPFFELNNRVYDMVTGGKDTPSYYARLQGLPEPPTPPADGKYAFFTQDGIGRIAFRRAATGLLAVAPYIGMHRISRVYFGTGNAAKHSIAGIAAKEYPAYAGFALYTGATEVLNDTYDALFQRLEAQEKQK